MTTEQQVSVLIPVEDSLSLSETEKMWNLLISKLTWIIYNYLKLYVILILLNFSEVLIFPRKQHLDEISWGNETVTSG